MRNFKEEGGMQALAGIALFSQTLGSILRTTWPAKLARKIQQKVCSVNGTAHF